MGRMVMGTTYHRLRRLDKFSQGNLPWGMDVCRFAPTASGHAHPGTLLAFLLAWLDARQRGARFILRLEDIDPSSVTDSFRQAILEELTWFGLDWDELVWQSQCRHSHEEALDRLAQAGRLYECSCTRTQVKRTGVPSASGGWVYPGTCRGRRITQWRDAKDNVRCDLSGISISLFDESGLDLSQEPAVVMGDPVVLRHDGTMTYQLAVVADDHFGGVNRVVRGRDIASSTATQAALHQLLGWDIPVYRHHLLLLEPRGDKLAKFHGSVGADVLRGFYSPKELAGYLAHCAGLLREPLSTDPRDLVKDFAWEKVSAQDLGLDWDGMKLKKMTLSGFDKSPNGS